MRRARETASIRQISSALVIAQSLLSTAQPADTSENQSASGYGGVRT
jgi:hypothetical protein